MNNIRLFISKHQLPLFFLFSTVLGYSPWYISGEPGWFMAGMPLTGFLLVLITKGKKGIMDQLKNVVRIKSKLSYYMDILGILAGSCFITLFRLYYLRMSLNLR